MKNFNAAIFLLSSRKSILPTCLHYLNKNLNKEKYPIHVFHFDDIYSPEYIETLKSSLGQDNLYFHEIPYGVPDHIKEEDLYYNRNYLPYVSMYFPKSRIGYLHMEYFVSNFYKLDQISEYDYIVRIDDDSYFKKDLSCLGDFLKDLEDKNSKFGSAHFWNHVGENTLQTRENLWEFTNQFILENKIEIKNKRLLKCIEDQDQDRFHRLGWSAGNFNLYKSDLFKEPTWDLWIDLINEKGHIYTNRWGDQEVIGLYYYMTRKEEPFNFDLKKKELYSDKLPNCGEAPTTVRKD